VLLEQMQLQQLLSMANNESTYGDNDRPQVRYVDRLTLI
jgi:hypothetical protein